LHLFRCGRHDDGAAVAVRAFTQSLGLVLSTMVSVSFAIAITGIAAIVAVASVIVITVLSP
jgi:hypothetical protein